MRKTGLMLKAAALAGKPLEGMSYWVLRYGPGYRLVLVPQDLELRVIQVRESRARAKGGAPSKQ